MNLRKYCQPGDRDNWRNTFEASALLGFAFLAGQVTFCGWQHETLGLYARTFWVFPFVIWAALRFGARVTAIILLMFFVQSFWGAIHGAGVFATDQADTHLLNFLLFNASLIATGMGLAISNTERDLLYRAMDTGHSEILLFDTNTLRYRYINHSALKSLGYTKKEMMALTPLDSCPEFTRQSFRSLSAPLLEYKEQMLHFKTMHKRKDGSLYPVAVDLQLYKHGGKHYFLAVLVDIFEREKTENRLKTIIIHAQKLAEEQLSQINQELDRRIEEAVQASKAKDLLLLQQSQLAGMGEMIGNIAHQWRQPINSLGLILSDMEDAYAHGECDEEYLRSAVAQSNALIQKMSHTIDDFINFSREDKRLGIICLMRETETCLRLISATLQHHHITVTIHCPREVMVWGYANEFSQALMNVLTNAKDAIFSNNVTDGNIQIKISENNTFGILTISDNGGGIAADVLPRIFDPYFTTKQQGVGIGLYISRVAIEKNMHGSLDVKNTGKGAQFTIQLPNTQS